MLLNWITFFQEKSAKFDEQTYHEYLSHPQKYSSKKDKPNHCSEVQQIPKTHFILI